MSKLTGPLLSFGAKGQIGKTLVVSDWRGVKYARQYVVPANPQTAAQTEVRDTFAFLNSLWLVAPAIFRAPWTQNAVGRKYTDRNKLISENVGLLINQANCNLFIASPGALGGPPLEGIAAVGGALSGEIDVTVTNPTVPTGWTLASVSFIAFPDQDPQTAFVGPFATATDATDPYTATLSGLGSGVACQVFAYPVWTRPDGRTAYGASLTDQATATV